MNSIIQTRPAPLLVDLFSLKKIAVKEGQAKPVVGCKDLQSGYKGPAFPPIMQ